MPAGNVHGRGFSLQEIWNRVFDATNNRIRVSPTGLTLVGEQLTEGTTTSTSAVTLITSGTLSIVVATPILVVFSYRKDAGAAADFGMGLIVNATVVAEAAVNQTPDGSATAQAQNGVAAALIGPRNTNYLFASTGLFHTHVSTGGAVTGGGWFPARTAAWPAATITSIGVRGMCGEGAMTVAARDLRIYTLPV